MTQLNYTVGDIGSRRCVVNMATQDKKQQGGQQQCIKQLHH